MFKIMQTRGCIDVSDRCWRQKVTSIRRCWRFWPFGHQHPLSVYHSEGVTNIEIQSPTWDESISLKIKLQNLPFFVFFTILNACFFAKTKFFVNIIIWRCWAPFFSIIMSVGSTFCISFTIVFVWKMTQS